jgi:TPR repeat protein
MVGQKMKKHRPEGLKPEGFQLGNLRPGKFMRGKFMRGTVAGMAAGLALGISALALTGVAYADFDDAVLAYSQAKYENAQDLFRRYATAGDVKSKTALGDIYSGSMIEADIALIDPATTGINQDKSRALAWYILAANHDFESYNQSPTWRDVNAKYRAQARVNELMGTMSDKDVAKAQKRVVSILEAESEFDLYRLGKMYMTGAGLPKDNVKALQYFILASGRNTNSNSAATAIAGELMPLMSKKDIEKAEDKAANWQPPLPEPYKGHKTPKQEEMERKLEELRDREAAQALANIETEFADNDHLIQASLAALGYYLGPIDGSLGKESRVAVRNFQYSLVERKSNMTAEEKAQVRTGYLTLDQKVELIKQAAERKHPRSLYVYGIMNAKGIGVSANGKRAEKYLKESANYGYALAHYALGVYYRDGTQGEDKILPNVGKATYHLGQAVALGYEPARSELLKLYETVPATDTRGSYD